MALEAASLRLTEDLMAIADIFYIKNGDLAAIVPVNEPQLFTAAVSMKLIQLNIECRTIELFGPAISAIFGEGSAAQNSVEETLSNWLTTWPSEELLNEQRMNVLSNHLSEDFALGANSADDNFPLTPILVGLSKEPCGVILKFSGSVISKRLLSYMWAIRSYLSADRTVREVLVENVNQLLTQDMGAVGRELQPRQQELLRKVCDVLVAMAIQFSGEYRLPVQEKDSLN